MNKKYNIGLDIGTTSVGWAVVEADTQKIIRKGKGKNRKALWGVRLFEKAETAESRRQARSTRRRYDRRRQRIKLLQEEFKEEISKVDNTFFQKIQESKYHEKDTINKSVILNVEEKEKIRKYNDNYKTIYHLRKRLIEDPSKEDIRLVYLAIHHIIKYRGNFLYNGNNFRVDNLEISEYLNELFESFINYVKVLNFPENYNEIIDYKEFDKIILTPSKNDIKAKIKNLFLGISDNKNLGIELGKLLVGNKFSIKKLLLLEDLENDISISFSGTDYEDKYTDLEHLLGNMIETIDILKKLYDAVFLKRIFKGSNNASLSNLMVKRYDEHRNDLIFLKMILKNNKKLYNQLFKTKKTPCLYELYTHNKISYDDFSKELKKLVEKNFDNLSNSNLKEKWLLDVQKRIDTGDFLPRITDIENGKYPYQLNLSELKAIIENQGKHYPFLLKKINDKYKIEKLLEFKIPYYVGPLNNTTSKANESNKNAWMEKKIENIRITPYNFDEVIDKATTAEKFIKRMISHCTYLLNEYALPNNSILYSKYKVLNELKQIKVNNIKLSNDQQKNILKELFMKTNGTISDKKFKLYLHTSNEFNMYGSDINITGYSADGKFANTMQSFIDFFGAEGIFEGTSYNEDDAEEIIEWITIFEDKEILEKKIRDKFTELKEKKIKIILSKKYSGWGNLSKKLLTGLVVEDKKTGVPKNIMSLMNETDENFMQIINNDKYNFQKLIKENNNVVETKKVNYKLVENLATSPATKKGIYQSLKVIEEIINYMGYEPERIIIETARGEDKVKARKDDKKKQLLDLYSKIKEEQKLYQIDNFEEISKELKNTEKIDSQRLFLYFIQ